MSNDYNIIEEETEEIKEIENGILLESITTHRNVQVNMILCPTWGISCFMDDMIQSCEMDEEFYHHMLVFPSMYTKKDAKRVMIIGGGEGAVAREVLRWPLVEHIDMYDWDLDVIQLFQNKYPQWAKGAWTNPKLHLHFDNIFDIISTPPDKPYDVIIIDLFDPEEENRLQWAYLFEYLSFWAAPHAIIVIYAGVANPDVSIKDTIQPYQMLCHMILQQIKDKDINPYIVPVKSFMGDAIFLMLTDKARKDKNIQYKPIRVMDI
jgi:predicted membrane-bound spermidine synthase